MPRDKPWLKMWTEWLGDAKMDRLSLAEQGSWWRLVSLCHECGHLDENGKLDGALVVAGTPLSLAEIMKSLKITEEIDKAVFNQMVERMKAAGSLHWNSDTLFVTHYEERQRALTDTKEDRARRQRLRREAKEQETPAPATENPLQEGLERKERSKDKETPPLPEEEEEEEAEEESHAQSCHEISVTQAQGAKSRHGISVTQAQGAQSRHGISVTQAQGATQAQGNGISVTLAEFSRYYEEYIGLLNPRDADRMREFSEYYKSHGGEIDWIEEAFKSAPVNKRRWPYVQAILERYIEEGGPDGRTRGQPSKGVRPKPDQGRIKPIKRIRG